METIKLNFLDDKPKNYTGIVEYDNGTLEYFSNGKYHREDGPAIIHSDGSMWYFLNGLCHREDGPAIIYSQGVMYYLNDKFIITEDVNDWIKENNIQKVWNNSHKLLFKLTFG